MKSGGLVQPLGSSVRVEDSEDTEVRTLFWPPARTFWELMLGGVRALHVQFYPMLLPLLLNKYFFFYNYFSFIVE